MYVALDTNRWHIKLGLFIYYFNLPSHWSSFCGSCKHVDKYVKIYELYNMILKHLQSEIIKAKTTNKYVYAHP